MQLLRRAQWHHERKPRKAQWYTTVCVCIYRACLPGQRPNRVLDAVRRVGKGFSGLGLARRLRHPSPAHLVHRGAAEGPTIYKASGLLRSWTLWQRDGLGG